MEPNRIGIPPQLLGRVEGMRIPIVHLAPGLLGIDKPQGIASRPDPVFEGIRNIEEAINVQAEAGKPELQHHGIERLSVFNALEQEVTGVVLASTTEESRQHWKNEYGSLHFTFHYLIVCKATPDLSERECDLPLARHFVGKHMFVSHNLGKKAHTRFIPIESSEKASVWLASTRYPRLHQIRVHSRESGIPLLQDPVYEPMPPPEKALSRRPRDRENAKPRLEWIHALSIVPDSSLGTEPTEFTVPFPRFWRGYLRRMQLDPMVVAEKSLAVMQNRALPIP